MKKSNVLILGILLLAIVLGVFIGRETYQVDPNDYLWAVDDPNTDKYPDFYLSDIGTIKFDGKIFLLEFRGIFKFIESYPTAEEREALQ